MSLRAKLTTPVKPGFTVATLVADITKYGVPTVAVLEAVMNIPGIGTGASAPLQGAVSGAVAILSAVISVLSQVRTTHAVTAALAAVPPPAPAPAKTAAAKKKA